MRVSAWVLALAAVPALGQVAPAPLTVVCPQNYGTFGDSYSAPLQASGGTGFYQFTLTGTLPPGLQLFSTPVGAGVLRTIAGTPVAPGGTYAFTIQVTDSATPVPGTASASCSITTAPPVTLPATLPSGRLGTAYSASVAASGGNGPYSYQVTDSVLPAWLTLNGSTGQLSGTPPAIGTTPPFYILATDAFGRTAVQGYTISIAPALLTLACPSGTAFVGIPYSSALVASGGITPYRYSILTSSIVLPVAPDTGAISFTPSAPGPITFTAQATDAPGNFSQTATANCTINVVPQLTITTGNPLPAGIDRTPYTPVTLAATGGVPGYTWTATGLPAGLAIAGNILSGTPTQYGLFTVDFTVRDSAGLSATARRYLPIQPQAPTITSSSPLPNAIAGVAYTYTFTSTGGTQPTILWSAGTLPAGLSLSSQGVLSGIPRTPNTYTFDVTAASVCSTCVIPTDAPSITWPPRETTQSFRLTVGPTNLTVTTTSLPDGLEQSPYSAFLQATGATPPYTWSLAGGSLPPGLGLAGNGAIGGTPQSAGTFQFTVRVTDSSGQTATRELSIMIDERIPPLQIETAALAGGTVGVSYSQGLSASGGEPPYGWTATGLPPGLSVAGNTITGTPTRTGVYSVSVQVSDAARRTASRGFTLTIVAPPLVITTAAAADGVVGSPYSQTFAATGGIPPYRWAASGGALPPGTTMSSSGTLSGTPNSRGTFSFTVMVEDSEKKVTNKGFTVTIAAPGLSITTASLPPGTVNVPYSASLAAAGGAPPYTWSGGGGALTVGGGGTVSGTPSQQGAITVTAQVTDSAGATASRSFEVLIGGPALSITTASIGNGTVGVPYSASFAAAGGTPPYSWSMPAGWAGGLSFDSGGSLSGTPTDAGDYSIVVRVTDSQGNTATRGFNFTIDAPILTITTASLPRGTVGSGYYTVVAATGNIGPVTWSADGMPAGLSMDSGGALSGTPSAAGSFTVTARAADQGGRTASRSLSLTIGLPAAPPVTFAGVPDISGPASQPTLQLGLSNPYPVPLTGVVTLTFTPQSGRDDPAVQFSTGGRTASFTIPAGANTASFPVPNLGVQTGTVAGRITLTASLSAGGTDVTPSPAPSRTITINASAPVITEVRATRTAAGFDVQITGYSTTREVTQIVFRFTAAAGANLQTTESTVNVQPLFAGWFTGAASAGFGSRFTFTQPFTITGDTTAITSLSVTLVSGQGNSNTVTANLQ